MSTVLLIYDVCTCVFLSGQILQTANNSEKLNDSDHILTAHTLTGGSQNLRLMESGNSGQEMTYVEVGSKDVSSTEHGDWHLSDRQANK